MCLSSDLSGSFRLDQENRIRAPETAPSQFKLSDKQNWWALLFHTCFGRAFVSWVCWCFLLRAKQKCMLMHKRRTSRFFKGRYGLTLTCWYLPLVLTTHIHARIPAKSTSGPASSSLLLHSMNLSLLCNPSVVKVKRGHKPYGEGSAKFSKATQYYARGHAC